VHPRVRFAPSPTGYLHVGGARTALYNWLLARSQGGVFLLRGDDTDTERSTPEFQADILEGLRWLGLKWDEGLEVGGPHAPYLQSLRLDRYREAAGILRERGAGYFCFCSPTELEDRRREAVAGGRPPGYDGRCRALDRAESEARVAGGEPAVVRLAVPRPGESVFTDLVRGEIRFDHANVEDFVLLRSDGTPTYQLASAVDDVDFEITHVVRGEDLLSSTPKHILIATGLGRPAPDYAHLSLLMGPDGQKLSKRHGDTSLRAYREAGFLPEAMVNYLTLLGFAPMGDEAIFSREAAVGHFDLSRVSKNPAIFDNKKLSWMNGVYLRALPVAEFVGRAQPFLEASLGRRLSEDEAARFLQIARLVQARVELLTDVPRQTRFLFVDRVELDRASWDKVMARPEAPAALDGALARLAELSEWEKSSIEEALRGMLAELGLNPKLGLQPIRVAVTGSAVSPPLFESLAILGKERTLARIGSAVETSRGGN